MWQLAIVGESLPTSTFQCFHAFVCSYFRHLWRSIRTRSLSHGNHTAESDLRPELRKKTEITLWRIWERNGIWDCRFLQGSSQEFWCSCLVCLFLFRSFTCFTTLLTQNRKTGEQIISLMGWLLIFFFPSIIWFIGFIRRPVVSLVYPL